MSRLILWENIKNLTPIKECEETPKDEFDTYAMKKFHKQFHKLTKEEQKEVNDYVHTLDADGKEVKESKLEEARSIGSQNIKMITDMVNDMLKDKSIPKHDIEYKILDVLPQEVFDTWEGSYQEVERLIHDIVSKETFGITEGKDYGKVDKEKAFQLIQGADVIASSQENAFHNPLKYVGDMTEFFIEGSGNSLIASKGNQGDAGWEFIEFELKESKMEKIEEGVGSKHILKLRNDIRKLEQELGLEKEAWLPSEGTITDGRASQDYAKMQRLHKKLVKMAGDKEKYVKESTGNTPKINEDSLEGEIDVVTPEEVKEVAPEAVEQTLEGADEALYADAIVKVPELAGMDKNEVTKGLLDEAKEHLADIEEAGVQDSTLLLAKIVLKHLLECPEWYAVTDAAVELWKSQQDQTLDNKVENEESETPEQEQVEEIAEEGMKESIKSKIAEAIKVETLKEQVEMLTEAMDSMEEAYISDIFRLSEGKEEINSRDAELKNIRISLKENEEKIKNLSTLLETTQAELKSGKDKLNETIKLLEGKSLEVSTKENSIKEIKESYEEKLKETRVNVLAKVAGLTLDKTTISLLKECKSDDELLKKLEECRSKMVKSVLRENNTEKVVVGKVTENKKQSFLMDRMDKMLGL